MVVDFSKVDLHESPVLILLNTADEPIGVLGKATNIAADIKYNETSVLSFDVAAEVDGEPTPYYEVVQGFRTVDLHGIGRFILMNPEENDDGVKRVKVCQAYSLEYEFTLKKITLEKATYNFWNPAAPDGTLLGIILEKMPSWKVGYVDRELIGKYRTFEVADENVYNFMKGTVQNSYNCIFDFDTYSREINVRSALSVVPVNPIFLSNKNLVKEISVKENTENIVTRLNVNGADGVNIRDVNPSGTNEIINLDYFMTRDNFSQSIIDKYFTWKRTYRDYQLPYYNLSIEYSLQIMRKTTEQAALIELQGERKILENEQATIIQGMAMNVAGMNQQKLDDVNSRIARKDNEIATKQSEIDTLTSQCNEIYAKLAEINKTVRFQSFFSESEYLLLDRYIRDDAVSESSFVTQEVASYSTEDTGNEVSNVQFDIHSAKINRVTNAVNKDIYDVSGGTWKGGDIQAEIIHAAFEKASDNSFVLTAYFSKGSVGNDAFPKGCLSITGKVNRVTSDVPVNGTGSTLTISAQSGYLYFTHNTSEYEKRAIAWDLYEYGNQILEKVSQPSYTFSIDSANFLCLEEFDVFKNKLKHGERLYIGLDEDHILSPVFIGASFEYGDIASLSLNFCDTYSASNQIWSLKELLDQSVSMGKTTDLGKFTYSSFIDSGASTQVKNFMTSALDVSKNAILSSKDQAVSWDDAGIRLRKWANDEKTTYDPKQVWMNNNSILMTSNNWATAELAIGNFHDKNLGDCWGIVAPNLIGTLLAGSNLVIESEKKDGSNAVFKVDADGCALFNSTFDIIAQNKKTQISLDPQFGIAIGKYPLYTDYARSIRTVNTDNARFWVDTEGNLIFQGTLRAATGEFDGKVTAREGYIGDGSNGWIIGSTYIYNGRSALSGNANGVYIGTDGIALGNGTNIIKATATGEFTANNATITGDITAKSGKFGGFTIDGEAIKYNGLNYNATSGNGVYIGPRGLQLGSKFRVDSSGNLWAASGTFAGNVYAGNISYGGNAGYFNGGGLSDGTVSNGKIGSGAVTNSKIGSGAVTGSKIGSGVVTTNHTNSGINTSLGYADFANGVFNGWNTASHGTFQNIHISGYIELNGRFLGVNTVRVMTGPDTYRTIQYIG